MERVEFKFHVYIRYIREDVTIDLWSNNKENSLSIGGLEQSIREKTKEELSDRIIKNNREEWINFLKEADENQAKLGMVTVQSINDGESNKISENIDIDYRGAEKPYDDIETVQNFVNF